MWIKRELFSQMQAELEELRHECEVYAEIELEMQSKISGLTDSCEQYRKREEAGKAELTKQHDQFQSELNELYAKYEKTRDELNDTIDGLKKEVACRAIKFLDRQGLERFFIRPGSPISSVEHIDDRFIFKLDYASRIGDVIKFVLPEKLKLDNLMQLESLLAPRELTELSEILMLNRGAEGIRISYLPFTDLCWCDAQKNLAGCSGSAQSMDFYAAINLNMAGGEIGGLIVYARSEQGWECPEAVAYKRNIESLGAKRILVEKQDNKNEWGEETLTFTYGNLQINIITFADLGSSFATNNRNLLAEHAQEKDSMAKWEGKFSQIMDVWFRASSLYLQGASIPVTKASF